MCSGRQNRWDGIQIFVINKQVWHLRAGSEIERQRWVTALELAKAKAIKNLASGW